MMKKTLINFKPLSVRVVSAERELIRRLVYLTCMNLSWCILPVRSSILLQKTICETKLVGFWAAVDYTSSLNYANILFVIKGCLFDVHVFEANASYMW